MISHLSKGIASFFVKKKIIPRDQIESYAFGYQIILITMINWGIILLLMICMKMYETLLYIISVIILRHHTGGYHASSHLRCCILSIMAYLFVVFIIIIMPDRISKIATVFMITSAVIIVFRYAPIEHKNNPISENKIKIHRIYSLVLSIIFFMVVIVFLLSKHYVLALSLSLGMFQVGISLLVEQNIHKQRKEVKTL